MVNTCKRLRLQGLHQRPTFSILLSEVSTTELVEPVGRGARALQILAELEAKPSKDHIETDYQNLRLG